MTSPERSRGGAAPQNPVGAPASSDLERLKADLHEARALLVRQEKLASLGALTAGIAHEIKNPLNFVSNFAQLSSELVSEMRAELRASPDLRLADVGDILSDLETNVARIQEHAARAERITRSMLEQARGEAGRAEPTDINALVEESVKLAYHAHRAKAAEFNAEIEYQLDPHAGLVPAVPQDLSRVLLNLLSNAFYSVHRRAQLSDDAGDPYASNIVVQTKRTAEFVEIRICDNGTGMSPDVLARIFEPFFTTKPRGQGTGLGLSISHDIVTKGHGGTLYAESKENLGTNFTIKLPHSLPEEG